ncbi:MAG: LPS export ABC transporter periplasmic protein LptC [Treponema sp.]|nr:LPS export ABC transporter periplasmic protein LptC [Treponema sp.]
MLKVRLIYRNLISFLCFIVFTSCSLNYEVKKREAKNDQPEFLFQNVIFNRYENNRITVSVIAEKLEQYPSNVSYAKQVSFDFWNNSNERELSGSCRLLGMQSYNNIFTLYDNIQITDIKNESDIQASALRWNSEKKTLTSDKSKSVKVSKKSMEIEGTCFSADGDTNYFEFTSGVSGTIHLEEGN